MREAHDQFRAEIRDRLGVDPGTMALDGRLRRFPTKANPIDVFRDSRCVEDTRHAEGRCDQAEPHAR